MGIQDLGAAQFPNDFYLQTLRKRVTELQSDFDYHRNQQNHLEPKEITPEKHGGQTTRSLQSPNANFMSKFYDRKESGAAFLGIKCLPLIY